MKKEFVITMTSHERSNHKRILESIKTILMEQLDNIGDTTEKGMTISRIKLLEETINVFID